MDNNTMARLMLPVVYCFSSPLMASHNTSRMLDIMNVLFS
jgi:hypothetical protein